MKHQKISDKYSKWIIKFYSERFSNPIFFIWLTDLSDKEEKDQILITDSKKIIVAKSKKKISKKSLKKKDSIARFKKDKKMVGQKFKIKEIKFNKV